MTPPSRKHALEAELREIKRFEKEDRAANPKVVGTPGVGTPRRYIGEPKKCEVWGRQIGKCAGCGVWLPSPDDAEYDHIVPLELCGGNATGNIQALCVPCHKAKTREDIGRISKAKRQAKLMQPKEPSKRPLQSRNTFR